MTTLCELVVLQTFSSADASHMLCASPASFLSRGNLAWDVSNRVLTTPDLLCGRLSPLRNSLVRPVNSAALLRDQSENQYGVRCTSAVRPRRAPMESLAEGGISVLSLNLGQSTSFPPPHLFCVIDRSTHQTRFLPNSCHATFGLFNTMLARR